MDSWIRALIAVLLVVQAGPRGPVLRAQSETRFKLTADRSGVIPYFIAAAEPGSGYKQGDDALAVWALQEWERGLGGELHFRRSDEEAARCCV